MCNTPITLHVFYTLVQLLQLNSLLTQLEAQEKASGAVISNYTDFEQRLLAIKNQGAEPFGSVEGLRGYKVELESLNKAMKDAAVDSAAAAKMQKEFELATGESFEDRKSVVDALVAEQDRILGQEQQNKLAAVEGQALTGFSKEALTFDAAGRSDKAGFVGYFSDRHGFGQASPLKKPRIF